MVRSRWRQPFHEPRRAGAALAARAGSRDHACRRQRAAADRRRFRSSAISRPDIGVPRSDRRPDASQHVVQRERANRAHAGRGRRLFRADQHGPTRAWRFCGATGGRGRTTKADCRVRRETGAFYKRSKDSNPVRGHYGAAYRSSPSNTLSVSGRRAFGFSLACRRSGSAAGSPRLPIATTASSRYSSGALMTRRAAS